MDEKRCSSVRPHKPHWWSRTTRRTVIEETPGDTLVCGGSARVGLRDTRPDEIRRDARSGRNWAEETKQTPVGAYGPTCICGAGERLQEAALALRGKYGIPTGKCPRHPGGTVARKSGGTRYPGENGAR